MRGHTIQTLTVVGKSLCKTGKGVQVTAGALRRGGIDDWEEEEEVSKEKQPEAGL